ncbi:hypothetical protein [Timonella senegalensis]|uniref:hypothetical protein n=1 Tax=Timonella senegalensis TaxID=1465825 RepID=UPI002FDD5C6A
MGITDRVVLRQLDTQRQQTRTITDLEHTNRDLATDLRDTQALTRDLLRHIEETA